MDPEYDLEKEPVDRSRWIWAGIVVLLLAMIGVFFLAERPDPTQSTVRASHILIAFDPNNPVDRERAFKTASELRERLLKGESFAKLASEYSADPGSARRGGDLGHAERGSYVDAFEAYAWNAPLNEISEPIESPYGYHLITVRERYIAPGDKFEEELEKKVIEELKDQPVAPSNPRLGE